VSVGSEGDQVEGYHVHVGGGFGPDATIARLLYSDVVADEVPRRIEGLLRAYLSNRDGAAEGFAAFSRRLDADRLRRLTEEALA
jgi:ferredoxin-nitrite reductase